MQFFGSVAPSMSIALFIGVALVMSSSPPLPCPNLFVSRLLLLAVICFRPQGVLVELGAARPSSVRMRSTSCSRTLSSCVLSSSACLQRPARKLTKRIMSLSHRSNRWDVILWSAMEMNWNRQR